MNIPIYQIDAFANQPFTGNPAAVCLLEEWLDDGLLQQIAAENNVAETAFIIQNEEGYHIRWFTPTVEVDLCGHATLAAAFVLFNYLDISSQLVSFHSRSGVLKVEKKNDVLFLDFPADQLHEAEAPSTLLAAFNFPPQKVMKGKTDYLLIYPKEEDIRMLKPNLERIAETDCRGVIVSARGEHSDFVSRFFAPQTGIDEDPVTGSAHTTLAPYWSGELQQNRLVARQLSPRGGELSCEYLGDRVKIGGKACFFMKGSIYIE